MDWLASAALLISLVSVAIAWRAHGLASPAVVEAQMSGMGSLSENPERKPVEVLVHNRGPGVARKVRVAATDSVSGPAGRPLRTKVDGPVRLAAGDKASVSIPCRVLAEDVPRLVTVSWADSNWRRQRTHPNHTGPMIYFL